MNNTKETLRDRYVLLSKLIKAIEKRLTDLPEGRLKIKCIKNKRYYYQISEGDEKLVPDMDMIRALAQRSYLLSVLKAARSERDFLGQMLDRYPDECAETVYDDLSPDRKDLIQPIIVSDEDYVKAWLEEPYEPKEFEDGMPYFITLNGERVRSKSEQIIADRLKLRGIPYKYECPLQLSSGTIYPDFTILKMSERKILYLEHCGRMSDPNYANRNICRLNDYAMEGVLLGDKLFLTYESDKHPFDVRVLEKMIDELFR